MTHTTALDALQAMLPQGWTARPTKLEDADEVIALYNTYIARLGVNRTYTADTQRAEWTVPNHDMALNSAVVLNEAGKIVASADYWAIFTPPVQSNASLCVDADSPAEVWDALLAWLDHRAHSTALECPPELQVSVMAGAYEQDANLRAVLVRHGYSAVRRFYTMRIDMTEPPTPAPLPPAYRWEPYRHPEQLSDIVIVDRLAFRDHYGHIDLDFDEEVAEVRHYFESLPYFDPSLFFNVVEEATGTIVATNWNLIQEQGDPEAGYVDNVAVLREHRGKGIALAMLTKAFSALYERGKRSAVLGVDSENLTGALRLYEKAGMKPVFSRIRYEKIVRPGKDLATRELGEQHHD